MLKIAEQMFAYSLGNQVFVHKPFYPCLFSWQHPPFSQRLVLLSYPSLYGGSIVSPSHSERCFLNELLPWENELTDWIRFV